MDIVKEIQDHVESWTKQNISSDFVFRKYQLETIVYIIKSIITDNHETTIIEAPTGSGKSLICIIAAGVLSQYYKKTSYILCSDLFLWQQYADAIETYNLKEYGYLKGSIGNYTCHRNKQDFSCSKCRLAKVSLTQLKDKNWRNRNFYSCYDTCEYMQQRERAEKSKVTLLTYQLWLHHMNLVNNKENVSLNPALEITIQGWGQTRLSFPKRDIIFCDECHNIPDIVQQFCSPTISEEKDRTKILDIFDYILDNGFYISDPKLVCKMLKKPEFIVNSKRNNKGSNNKYRLDEIYDIDNIKREINLLFNAFSVFQEEPNKILDILKRYFDILTLTKWLGEIISDNIADDIKNNINEEKESAKITKIISWLDNYISAFNTFLNAISYSSSDYLLMEISEDLETKLRTFSLKCAKEDYLCWKYLLDHAEYKVMMSATVGMHSSFDDNIGITYTGQKTSYLVKLPSTFNYDKSPIYYIPTYKMNYANKNASLPKIAEMSAKIIAANKGSRGIIHTGSYENARYFYNNMPKELRNRLLLYGNSRQKEEIIDEFKYSKNKVLVGPTLMEGIDLPNDLCRFIILMKVPYPNITGKLVKKKIELFPFWYNSTTSNSIIQSIGRGVRNENDYCTTYILDGCFGTLYEQTKEQYPQNIKDRLKFITG